MSWRWDEKADWGQVTVVFVTPATRDAVYDDLGAKAVPPAPTATTVAPGVLPQTNFKGGKGPQTDAMQGLWLVTHTRHVRYVVIQVGGTQFQVVVLPPIFIPDGTLVVAGSYLVVGCGDVGTFAPPFEDGGAAPFGLQC